MNYIDVCNLKIKDTIINFEVLENEKIGLFCVDKEITNSLMLILSGINKSQIKHYDTILFDNPNYVNNRLYLDFAVNYLSTLNAFVINNIVSETYNQEFNIQKYKNALKDFQMRREVSIQSSYTFTKSGFTLSNICLLLGMEVKNVLINNIFYNITSDQTKDLIVNKIVKNPSYNSVIINITTDILKFYDKLDKLIIIGVDKKSHTIIPNKTSFILIDDSILVRNKLFRKGLVVVSINDYTKEELKNFSKQKMKYKVCDFVEVIDFLGDSYE